MKIRFYFFLGILFLCHLTIVACPGLFNPGIDVDEEDQCFVLDVDFTIDAHGSEQSEFNLPLDIDMDKDGFLYITDSSNSRIQKFDSSGQFITEFGNNELLYPHGIAVSDSGNVYVSDKGNKRIVQYNSSGGFVSVLSIYIDNGEIDAGEFNTPEAIDITTDNSLLAVYDNIYNNIQIFDGSNWNLIKEYYPDINYNEDDKILFSSYDILNLMIEKDTEGHVYLYLILKKNSLDENYVIRLIKDDTTYQFSHDIYYGSDLGTISIQNGFFNQPNGLDIGQDNFIFVSDSFNNRIQLFDITGDFVETWQKDGILNTTNNDKLDYPTGIVVDNDLNVYVLESANDRVKKFTYRCNIEE